MKKCNKCNKIKEKFRPQSRSCTDCYRAYRRKYHLENREKVNAYKRKYARRKRKEMSDFLNKIKEDSGCIDCKNKLRSYQLHFDHLPKYTKKFNISEFKWSKVNKELMDEIAKCEVVCANCHAERTWNRYKNK